MINDEKLKEIAEKLSDKLSAYDLLKLSKNIIHLVYNDIYYEVNTEEEQHDLNKIFTILNDLNNLIKENK